MFWCSLFAATAPALAVSAAVSLAGTATEQPRRLGRPSPRAVRVVWVETVDLEPFAYAGMVDEASAIFERLGLVLRLSRGRMDDTNRPGELRIVSVDRFAPDRPILGAALIPWSREGTARICIFRPQVRLFIERSTPSLAAARAEGIVLGRIVAHETVHALAPRLGHAQAGLMARQMTPSSLRTVPIDAATIAAVLDAAIALEDAGEADISQALRGRSSSP